jgi:hypothetical protein
MFFNRIDDALLNRIINVQRHSYCGFREDGRVQEEVDVYHLHTQVQL